MKTINRIKVCTMHPEETYTNENFHFSTFSVFLFSWLSGEHAQQIFLENESTVKPV